MQMNTKNAERYETELGDRETVLTGNVMALPTLRHVEYRPHFDTLGQQDR
jgi:hypothetical protein